MRKIYKGEKIDFYNPFGEMGYVPLLIGAAHGFTKAKDIMVKGDLSNKWIEQINTNEAFVIPKGDRNRYGRGKAYMPVIIKAFGRKLDLNIFNWAKVSSRSLSAEDSFVHSSSYEMEVADIVREKIGKKTGLRGRALTKAVLDEITNRALPPDVIDAMKAQVEKEAAKYEENFNTKVSQNTKKIRLKELKIERLNLTAEEQKDADEIARDNVFTADRYGLSSRLARRMGAIINYAIPTADRYGLSSRLARRMGAIINYAIPTALLLKPIVPFTRIVGNVTEALLDHDPVLGTLRAHGLSITGLIDRATRGKLLHGQTSQKGPIGSRQYYDQMGRASVGAVAYVMLAALTLGTDEDDWIQVTGAYAQEGWKKEGRKYVEPKYSIGIGRPGGKKFWISYLNLPPLAIPLGLIGNANDRLRQNIGEETVMERIAVLLSQKNIGQTMLMVKDMSFVESVERMTRALMGAVDEDPDVRERAGKNALLHLAKTYTKFAVSPSPHQNNLLKQMEKILDPVSYSQKDIKELLAYAAGIHFFVNNPNIDIFGDEIKSWPGETLMPYTHWFGLRGDDRRWAFLAKYNAIPERVFNQTFTFTDEITYRRMTSDELYQYAVLSGQNFDIALRNYIGAENWWDRSNEIEYFFEEHIMTGVQVDVAQMWGKAKREARDAMHVVNGSWKPRTVEQIIERFE